MVAEMFNIIGFQPSKMISNVVFQDENSENQALFLISQSIYIFIYTLIFGKKGGGRGVKKMFFVSIYLGQFSE